MSPIIIKGNTAPIERLERGLYENRFIAHSYFEIQFVSLLNFEDCKKKSHVKLIYFAHQRFYAFSCLSSQLPYFLEVCPRQLIFLNS